MDKEQADALSTFGTIDPVRFSIALVDAAPPADLCPHLAVDVEGPFCLAMIDQGMLTARGAVGYASLQLWCIAGASRWPICAYHPESVNVR
jgi:hypothetical protein